ncbi:MAG: NmrA family transcriptional regulator [Herpetosiphonaceae bacterium]|nr:MAG: NmrA family transcriptional regulator [Herpetosiphonaceae bacterium]
MKLAIFGATGRTGKQLVEQALQQGHEVIAFARNPAKLGIQHERLKVVEGDVYKAEDVERAVVGADAVMMALGHTKGTTTKDVLTVATKNVLAAMKKHNVRRLVNITGAGVADPNDRPRLFNKVMSFLLKRMAGDLLADSQCQSEAIRWSDLDWVIVRVPMLTDGPKTGHVRVGYVGQGTGARITRADAADFMLKLVTDTTYLRKAPMISN